VIRHRFAFGALAAGLILFAGPAAAQRWRMQYFYDEEKSSLVLLDLKFASAQRGVAVGYVLTGRTQKPVALVTSDGGAHWQQTALEDTPVSLFFLNENIGWLVTGKGLWVTREAGHGWTRLPRVPAQILRVCFVDENNGWAVGAKKTVLATHDAGQHWTPVQAAAEQPGEPAYSAYNTITFPTPQFGLVTGWNIPPRRWLQDEPDWMDPEAALDTRDTPHLSYTLFTNDGGKTWKSSSASLFGETERILLSPGGVGLGLVVHSAGFQYSSEVYQIDWPTGKSTSLYRDKKFSVTDIWMGPDQTAYLAGILNGGQLRGVIPGKVQVLSSRDYTGWNEADVDYRATANRVMLAAVDSTHMWIATDTGMILRLEPAP
jgi:photosystem II stability/assembly factor-like uncharacterized protein